MDAQPFGLGKKMMLPPIVMPSPGFISPPVPQAVPPAIADVLIAVDPILLSSSNPKRG